MFESALMESAGSTASRPRWLSLAAFVLNGSILALLVLWPLLHPAALPRQDLATLLVAPAPPAPPARITPPSASPVTRRVQTVQMALLAPSKIPKTIATMHEGPAPGPGGIVGMEGLSNGSPGSIPGSLLTAAAPAPVARSPRPKKVVISSGVMAGNRLSGASPQYPSIAKSARMQGAVVLAASISKTGSIENLRVVSGPPMLQPAALDAVRTWRYKPYLLNGEPVAVDTTIAVIFHLGEG